MPKRSRSASICDGLRNTCFVHIGRGFFPFLAVMLLATPQLAFAQDSLAVTMDPRSLTVVEEDTAEYTVKLDAAPSEDVVITVGGTTADLTVNPTSLTFMPGTYDTAQTFEVTAGDDANAVDETVTLTHTAMIGDDEDEVALRNATVTVMVDDNDTKLVTLSTNTVFFLEATQTGEYTVVLNTEPTATVTVDIAGASGEITVSPSRLFFTADNYAMAQTVTVFAGEDFDAEDDTATLTHTVRGGDYTGVPAGSEADRENSMVLVTVDDNDTRGVSVSTDSLTIAQGVNATYTIVLDTQPTGNVTISVTEDPNNENEGVSATSSVRFSRGDWNRPKPVTVRVTSSATGSVDLVHAITDASGKDESYDGATIDNDTVAVTVREATSGIRLSTSSLTVNEGTSRTYTVRVASRPSADVTVSLASSDVDVTVDTNADTDGNQATLTFTAPVDAENPGNWNTAQPVTVTAAEDEDGVTDTATVAHTIGDVTVAGGTLRVTVSENDTRGVELDQTSLEVAEGGSATYTIRLKTQPTDNVTVTVTGASGDVTVNPSQRTFTTTDWFEAKEVVVSAAEDPDGEPENAVTLRHTVRGGDYDGLRGVDSVRVTVTENEMIGVTASTDSLTMMEGETGEYTVKLRSQPTGTVTVMVRADSGDVTLTPSRLIFTTSTWDTEQTVEVKALQDADAEQDADITLTHAASGGGYSGLTGDQMGKVTVRITEDDQKGVIITPTALTVDEGSTASTYTIRLNSQPTGPVTVTLGGLGLETAKMESLTVAPTRLTFTQRNWNIAQSVTVRADEDANGAHGTVTLTHAVRGGGYDSTSTPPTVTAKNVDVRVVDNDTAGLSVTPMSLEIPEGSSQTYRVVLKTQPTMDVTVNITGGGTDVSATPTPLTFTPDNWFRERPVTVHVAADATAPSATLENAATSSDSDYNVSENVAVEVMDSDTPDVAVNPTSLTITEGGSDSYTMVLTKAPTAPVSVAISGASDDVRVSGRSVSFSIGNWNRAQTVTVSVAEDEDAAQDVPVTLTHKVSGADEYEKDDDGDPRPAISSVRVTINENDNKGVTVSPTSLTIAAGVSGTYRVRLNTQPTDTVSVTVDSPRNDVTVTGSPVIFTTSNWNADQTVTVMVDEDAGGEEMQSVTLTHSVSGGDYQGIGVADVVVTIPVEGAPGAPRNLRATGGDQQVRLSWTAPASDGGLAIVRYQHRYQQSGSSFTEWANVPGGASATSYTVTGLESGASYTFEVRAVNSVGGGQGATASATLADSAPGAPSNLEADAGDEQVTLTWGAPADGGSQIIRYEYRYAASGETYSDWATVSGAGNARSRTVTGLTNGTEYGFQVRAVNSIGEGAAAEDSATPGRAPTAPTGLTARVESETITVMWGMPADTGGSAVTGYQVRYRMNGGQWSNWMAVAGGASATSYTMTGLTNGIGHEIEVRAVNAIGTGASASVEATPMEGIDFAHFANGQSTGVTITSDIVLVNVETSTVTPAIYFYNQMGEMIPADSVVDLMGDLEVADDGALTVPMGIRGRGEITISTNGEGSLVVGSVRVFASGRIGGVLRFDIPAIGVAGVGASKPVNDAIFPARRIEGGINTGAAVRNLSAEPMIVTCHLMKDGRMMDAKMVDLAGNGHSSEFIDQMFPGSNTTAFVGSVRCMAPEGGMFTGVAVEMDLFGGQIFTTLPVVPYDAVVSDDGMSMLNFAHFANGEFGGVPITSDLVFVNVANTAVDPVIYFYDRDGNMIDADMVVDAMMDGVEVDEDGALMVMDEIPPMGEMTISTSGMGDGMRGSVRVVSDGPIGGVLRFDSPNIGVAGVGASEAVNAAIFPARRMAGGINTGVAIRNLDSEATTVTCRLMADGQRMRMGEETIDLAGNGQSSMFINEIFMDADTDDFEGSVHCTAPAGSMFTGVALEMDFNNRIFTTLPVVPVR